MAKNLNPGSGMNIPDNFPESLETVFRDPGPGIFLILGQDGKKIRIRDPQRWSFLFKRKEKLASLRLCLV
jgi:hypothetical protein